MQNPLKENKTSKLWVNYKTSFQPNWSTRWGISLNSLGVNTIENSRSSPSLHKQ